MPASLIRVSLATQLKTLVALPRGIFYCMGLLRRWQPQVVVGVGGYASGPGMLAALLQRVPTLAFEPNAVPGLANRLIGKRIRAAAVNFAPTLAYFRNALSHWNSRPSRFLRAPTPFQGKPAPATRYGRKPGCARPQPAHAGDCPRATGTLSPPSIPHQAGARHAETTEAAYAASGAARDRWQVQAFLEDMPAQFAASDLILARSGASTAAES